jgi:hypothetical protein
MPRTSFIACPSCARHIRSTEPACPFCQSPSPPAFRSVRVPAPPRLRLSRAALAFGASALAATYGCGGTSGSVLEDAGVDDGSMDVAQDRDTDADCLSGALYGGFPGDGCHGHSAPDAAVNDAGRQSDGYPPNYCDVISHAAYGAPPPECQ